MSKQVRVIKFYQKLAERNKRLPGGGGRDRGDFQVRDAQFDSFVSDSDTRVDFVNLRLPNFFLELIRYKLVPVDS